MAHYNLVNGRLVELTPEQIAARTAEQAQYDAEMEPRAWEALRKERNKRLADSDWTQVADTPVDQATWAIYRQALRDLPENTTDPFNPVWPIKPT